MTAKNMFLVLTASVGLVTGSLLSKAKQLDEMTAILKAANDKVAVSLGTAGASSTYIRKKAYNHASRLSRKPNFSKARSIEEKKKHNAPASKLPEGTKSSCKDSTLKFPQNDSLLKGGPRTARL
jgi:hypothetical protein